MPKFEHIRHKPPTALEQERPFIVACAPFRSNVNLATIVRTAACCGIQQIIACGRTKIDPKIARDGAEHVEITARRTLAPVLVKLKQEGYTLVGLEQTTNSENLHEFSYPHKTALIVGSEREGLTQEALNHLDHVIEIPVWGLPYSYNVATATSMAIYEYCPRLSW